MVGCECIADDRRFIGSLLEPLLLELVDHHLLDGIFGLFRVFLQELVGRSHLPQGVVDLE